LTALALAACASAPADEAPGQGAPALSPQEILDQSPPADWRPLDPENTLYMELPQGRVILELAPHFAPNHAANIRALTRAGYFDNSAILRSQDNYVVQWGRDDDDPLPLGEGAETVAHE